MGNSKSKTSGGSEGAGEARLRDGSLSNDEKRTSVDEIAQQTQQSTDAVLRTDDEEDSLYEDGLDLEKGSRPLTGINGKDDSR